MTDLDDGVPGVLGHDAVALLAHLILNDELDDELLLENSASEDLQPKGLYFPKNRNEL